MTIHCQLQEHSWEREFHLNKSWANGDERRLQKKKELSLYFKAISSPPPKHFLCTSNLPKPFSSQLGPALFWESRANHGQVSPGGRGGEMLINE